MTYPPRFAGFRCKCGGAFVWYFTNKGAEKRFLAGYSPGRERRHRCSKCGRSPTWEGSHEA